MIVSPKTQVPKHMIQDPQILSKKYKIESNSKSQNGILQTQGPKIIMFLNIRPVNVIQNDKTHIRKSQNCKFVTYDSNKSPIKIGPKSQVSNRKTQTKKLDERIIRPKTKY